MSYKKAMKIIGIILVAIVILITAAGIFIKSYFTSEKIKGIVLPHAKKALGRKLSIEDINISILTGIEISNIAIQDNPAFRSAPFLTAEEFILKYAFWPLLKKKLLIHKLIIVKPQIFIERNEEGAFNFNDLIPKPDTESAPSPSTQKPSTAASQAFLLTISQIDIRDGQITFADKTIPSPSPLILDKFMLKARDISLTNPFKVSLSARLQGNQNPASLSLSGKIDISSQSTDLQLGLDNLDIAAFSPYYDQLIPLQLLSSRLGIQAHIQNTGMKKILTEGKINLKKISFIYPTISSKEPVQNLDLAVNYAVDADLLQQLLKIDRLTLTTLQVPLHISGQISHFKSDARTLDLVASLSEIDLNNLQKSIPSLLLPAIIKKISARGKLSGLELKIQGPLGQSSSPLTYSGKGRLADVQITYQPFSSLIPKINGTIEIDQEKLQLTQIKIALFNSETSLSGTVFNYLKKPVIKCKVESTIPDLARMIKAIPSDLCPILQKIKVQGALHMIAHLAGNPANPSALRYNGETNLRDITVNYAPYSALSPHIKGTVQFNEKEIITENLQTSLAKSDLTLKGKVKNYRKVPSINFDVISKNLSIDEILAGIQQQTTSASTPSQSGLSKAPAQTSDQKSTDQEIGPFDFKGLLASGTISAAKVQYKTLTINDLKTAYSIKDNIVRLKNLKANTGDKGSMTMDGQLNCSHMSYSSQLDIQSLPIKEMLSVFMPKYASIFSGDLSTKINKIAGQGFSKEKIQQNLYLEDTFEMVNAKIQAKELGGGISSLLRIANLSDLEFDSIKGQIKVQKGKIYLDSDLTSEDYILEPKGTIGLDSSLNVNLPVKISPRVSQKNKFLHQYLTDDKGWTTVSIKATGTTTKPKLTIDLTAVRKDAEKKLKKKVKEKLLEKLFKIDKEKDKEKDNSAPKSDKDILKDTLKNLFK